MNAAETQQFLVLLKIMESSKQTDSYSEVTQGLRCKGLSTADPKTGQSLAGRGLRMQVVGLEASTILNNDYSNIVSKFIRAETICNSIIWDIVLK